MNAKRCGMLALCGVALNECARVLASKCWTSRVGDRWMSGEGVGPAARKARCRRASRQKRFALSGCPRVAIHYTQQGVRKFLFDCHGKFRGLDDRLIAAGPHRPRHFPSAAFTSHTCDPDRGALRCGFASDFSLASDCDPSFARRDSPTGAPVFYLRHAVAGEATSLRWRRLLRPQKLNFGGNALRPREGQVKPEHSTGVTYPGPGVGLLPFVDRARIRESTSRT